MKIKATIFFKDKPININNGVAGNWNNVFGQIEIDKSLDYQDLKTDKNNFVNVFSLKDEKELLIKIPIDNISMILFADLEDWAKGKNK